jgi:hypothetical protein
MDEELNTISAPEVAPEVPSEAPAKSVGDALDNAFDSIFTDEPEMQSTRARDEAGRFAAKAPEAKPVEVKPDAAPEAIKPDAAPKPLNPEEPPTRLSAEAKAAWKAAPPAIKADVHRAFSEMEQGIAKYRPDATRYQTEIAPYEQLAQQYGMDVKGVLADYEGMARTMATDPIKVFDTLAKRHGFTLPDLAAHVLNMDLDDAIAPVLDENKRLQAEVMELRKAQQGYTQQQSTQIQGFIAEFAVRNPRYDELEPQIAAILRSGLVTAQDPKTKLQEAYDMAAQLKPAPQVPAPQQTSRQAQTLKGQLSVTGAPGTGSDPARRKAPASTRDALDRAFDQFGI